MSINDVVIHVNETLNPDSQHNLEDQMRDIQGVIAPRFNARRPRLMIVAYDPEHTNTMSVPDAVRSQGCHAQLCGA
jgi:hypothetical protein